MADYEPSGAIYKLRTADTHEPIRFPGQEAEELDASQGPNGASSRLYNGFRWYRPQWGRYTQSDPIGYDGSLFNLYGYVSANPVNGSDILGLCTAPNSLVRMPLPANVQKCTTSTGVSFLAPPGFSISDIASDGETNGLLGAGAAVGQGGYYDYQRKRVGSITQFFSGYTPVANVAVGAYVEGTGAPRWLASLLSNIYAQIYSSNGATAQQAQFRNLGFSLADGEATYTCHP